MSRVLQLRKTHLLPFCVVVGVRSLLSEIEFVVANTVGTLRRVAVSPSFCLSSFASLFQSELFERSVSSWRSLQPRCGVCTSIDIGRSNIA